jgi:hypothetical protein
VTFDKDAVYSYIAMANEALTVEIPSVRCPRRCMLKAARAACDMRRRHVHMLRGEAARRDAFASVVPFGSRFVGNDSFVKAGTLPARKFVGNLDNLAPATCDAVFGGGADPMSIALLLTGPSKRLSNTMPRTVGMMQGYNNWVIVANVHADFPLENEDAESLRAIASQGNLVALLATDTAVYPLMKADVLKDHSIIPKLKQSWHGHPSVASTSDESSEDALLRHLRIALGAMLRRMYEVRCGGRFDVTLRMRSDAFLRHPLGTLIPLPWRDDRVYIDQESDHNGINDEWSCLPSRYNDRLMDLYFRVPSLLTQVGWFQPHIMMKILVAEKGRVARPALRAAALAEASASPP